LFVVGWVVNKFCGDVGLLWFGLCMLEECMGWLVLGVVFWLDGVWFDGEDVFVVGGWCFGGVVLGCSMGILWVVVVCFFWVLNVIDVDVLVYEFGVVVDVIVDFDMVLVSDLVVLFGSWVMVLDLVWLCVMGIVEVFWV